MSTGPPPRGSAAQDQVLGPDVLRATFERAPVGLAQVATDGRFLHVNACFAELVGRSASSLRGMTFAEITHPDHRTEDLESAHAVLDGTLDSYTMDKRYLREDGSSVWVALSVSLVRDEDGEPDFFIAVASPVGARKEAERAVAASKERFERIFSAVPVSIWEEDWTDVIEAVRGLEVRDLSEFAEYLQSHPEFIHEMLRAVKILNVNQRTCDLFEADDKAQLLESLEVVFATDDTLPGFVGELVALFEGREVYEAEMALRTIHGRRIEVLLTMSFPASQEDAGAGIVLVSLMDITALRQAQRALGDRNRDLETLLYVASHDLREPLRAIETFSSMVARRYSERLDDKGQDFLARVVRGARRMDDLLERLLVLSRAQRLEPPAEGTPSVEIVERALLELEERIRETSASVEVVGNFPALRVDKTWACRALVNLVGNALKFTGDGRAPEVQIVPYVTRDQAGVAVRDRGPGVPPEARERIFEMFRRGSGREIPGYGAGLAIVRQIAERHGGQVWLEARDGGGTEFVVTFGPSREADQEKADE